MNEQIKRADPRHEDDAGGRLYPPGAAVHDAASGKAQERVMKAVQFSNEVQQEDIALCESVQRGLRSSTYDRGRYSVRRKNSVRHFHLLLREFLERS